MTHNNVLEKKSKILCTILLSIFLVISGVYVACKCAFSEDVSMPIAEENFDKVTEESENGVSNRINESYSDLKKSETGTELKSGLIVPGEYDIREIPDKYNTGCGTDLVVID